MTTLNLDPTLSCPTWCNGSHDELHDGPYSYLIHERRFELEDGATIVLDRSDGDPNGDDYTCGSIAVTIDAEAAAPGYGGTGAATVAATVRQWAAALEQVADLLDGGEVPSTPARPNPRAHDVRGRRG